MADSLAGDMAGLALAAGSGSRLAPLTLLRPKPLCPVGEQPLIDWALDSLATAVDDLAVNVHHHAGQLADHVEPRGVHVVHEAEVALGTAGAVANLAGWLDGRSALVVNGDTYQRCDLGSFVSGWDGERVRVLTSSPLPFGPRSGVVASIVPWSFVCGLEVVPSGLWERLWRHGVEAATLDAVHYDGVVVDCATPADYLRANMAVSGGASVIGAGARVAGLLERSVVWPGAEVGPSEVLVDAIRAARRTVLVR